MLLVKTYIGPSEVHGNGLFADEHIPVGTEIWKPGFEMIYDEQYLLELPPIQHALVMNCGWKDSIDGFWHLSFDNDRFINHSVVRANVGWNKDHSKWVALELIMPDEEILENYYGYDSSATSRLKYHP
jgi:uncharacterized protein